MDLDAALEWTPPADWRRVVSIESHTGGEPFRVVVAGGPEIPGSTMLERRRHAQGHLDELRRALMWEPRGHADMYGCFIGPPVSTNGDLSVLFLHNEGFSTMCGHGIIALTKVVLDTGILPVTGPETSLRIDTPAGQVEAVASVADGVTGKVRFRNVPSFVVDLDQKVAVEGMGEVRYDLAFGGGFYAYVDAEDVGLTLGPDHTAGIIEKGRAIKRAVMSDRDIPHPNEPELGFLYGTIFVGPAADPAHHSRNVCVFADGEVDRSPTGTGVSGRLAIHHSRGEISLGEAITVESIVGSTFTGRVAGTTRIGGIGAVIPEVEGEAHITGRNEHWIDPTDPHGAGFVLR